MKTLFALCVILLLAAPAFADCPACKAQKASPCECGGSCKNYGCDSDKQCVAAPHAPAALTINIPAGTPYCERRWIGPFGRQRIFIRYRR